MSAERDAGYRALQSGNVPEAVTSLERAVAATPDDFQTLLYLGAAYGQAGRHGEAVGTLTKAVTLQPSSATARYNLALAYETAGHKEYALQAAQQAVQLQPDYPKAQELAARLSGAPAPASSVQPTQYGQPAPTQYGQAPQPTQMPYGQAPQQPYAPSQPPYGQAQSGYGQPGQAYPGAAQPGAYAPPSGYQGAAAYGGAPAAKAYNPYMATPVIQTPDVFDMKQAMKDWKRVIMEPHAFYREQAQRQGYNAPLSFLVMFGIAAALINVLSGIIRIVVEPSMALNAIMGMAYGLVGGIMGALMGAFVWGGVLHIIGKMFGNRAPYHASFRVVAYARAPLLFTSLLIAVILPFVLPLSTLQPKTPGQPSPFGQVVPVQYSEPSQTTPGAPTFPFPGGTTRSTPGGPRSGNPFDTPAMQTLIRAYEYIGVISLLGMIWPLCLEAIGLRYAQNLSPGGAAGTVIVAVLIPLIGLVLIGVLFGMLIAAAMSSSRSGFLSPELPLSLLKYGQAMWYGR